MGGGALLARSVTSLAEEVVRLGGACAAAAPPEVELHPLNDGVFALADDRTAIQAYLSRALGRLAATAVAAPVEKRRLVRAALAYGEVVTLRHAFPTHTSTVVLGIAKGHAFRGEEAAAPFGVHVHPSAIAAGVAVDWRWYATPPGAVLAALEEYFAWANATDLYPAARITAHAQAARSYFAQP